MKKRQPLQQMANLQIGRKLKNTYIKIKNWDLIKFMSFCMAKKTISKTKRQPADWEKIFVNDVTHKGLISKIYKLLTNSITSTTKRHTTK